MKRIRAVSPKIIIQPAIPRSCSDKTITGNRIVWEKRGHEPFLSAFDPLVTTGAGEEAGS